MHISLQTLLVSTLVMYIPVAEATGNNFKLAPILGASIFGIAAIGAFVFYFFSKKNQPLLKKEADDSPKRDLEVAAPQSQPQALTSVSDPIERSLPETGRVSSIANKFEEMSKVQTEEELKSERTTQEKKLLDEQKALDEKNRLDDERKKQEELKRQELLRLQQSRQDELNKKQELIRQEEKAAQILAERQKQLEEQKKLEVEREKERQSQREQERQRQNEHQRELEREREEREKKLQREKELEREREEQLQREKELKRERELEVEREKERLRELETQKATEFQHQLDNKQAELHKPSETEKETLTETPIDIPPKLELPFISEPLETQSEPMKFESPNRLKKKAGSHLNFTSSPESPSRLGRRSPSFSDLQRPDIDKIISEDYSDPSYDEPQPRERERAFSESASAPPQIFFDEPAPKINPIPMIKNSLYPVIPSHCFVCHGSIFGKPIETPSGRRFHPRCFTCAKCQKRIAGKYFPYEHPPTAPPTDVEWFLCEYCSNSLKQRPNFIKKY